MLFLKLMKDQEFNPTSSMRLYAYQRAKLGDTASQAEVAKGIGVSPETVSRWKKIKGFKSWLNEELMVLRIPMHDRLEQAALQRIGDWRFWRELAIRHGYIREKSFSEFESYDGFDI